MNKPVRLLRWLVGLYQGYTANRLSSCRFTPTCSYYALEALASHGALHGSWLTLRRLLRCNPFARRFGSDPVPPVDSRRPV